MKKEFAEILSQLRELLPYIRQKYNVSSVEIFGSFVRNQQDFNSDLDLLVSFEHHHHY